MSPCLGEVQLTVLQLSAGTNGISRFSRFGFSTPCQGLRLAVSLGTCISEQAMLLPLVGTTGGTRKEDFGAQYLAALPVCALSPDVYRSRTFAERRRWYSSS